MGKRLLFLGMVFVLVFVLTPGVFAVGYIGRPTAELNKGQWSAGFNYSYSTQDMEKTNVKGTELDWDDEDVDYSGSYRYKVDTKDVTTQRYYGRVAYGISDCWTLYGQLGGADVKADIKDIEDYDEWGINFDNDFAWGWGTKYTFTKQPKTNWGVALEMNWLNTSASQKGAWDDGDTDYGSWKDEVNLKTWDLLIAVGPTIDMGGWRLYGGPFYYYLCGDQDGKYTEEGYDGYDTDYSTWRESSDLRAEDNFGGYIGAQVDFSKNCNGTVEFSATGSGWGVGAGLTFLCK